MVTHDMTLDDDNWSTKELAKLYCSAAKLAGYSNSAIAYCRKNVSRQNILA